MRIYYIAGLLHLTVDKYIIIYRKKQKNKNRICTYYINNNKKKKKKRQSYNNCRRCLYDTFVHLHLRARTIQ